VNSPYWLPGQLGEADAQMAEEAARFDKPLPSQRQLL
jgi:hypothetical protein